VGVQEVAIAGVTSPLHSLTPRWESRFLCTTHCYNRRLTPSTKRILRVWLPSAVWLTVIAVESTNLGSAEHTGQILYPIFHFVFDMDPPRFAMWHALLRKTGHVVGYFTLSVLLFRSWRATFPGLARDGACNGLRLRC
jgi:hypothetical protein